jgi:hypothetical protein
MPQIIRRTLAVAFALAMGVTLAAQAKPNFSGEWTMIPGKSDFGPLPPPASMTRTITHADPAFKVVTVQRGGSMGDTTLEMNFTTDGKPQQNTLNGAVMTTVGKWDAGTIVLNSTLSQGGAEVKIEDRYSLSDAGKTLTIVRKFDMADGSAAATVVLAKK